MSTANGRQRIKTDLIGSSLETNCRAQPTQITLDARLNCSGVRADYSLSTIRCTLHCGKCEQCSSDFRPYYPEKTFVQILAAANFFNHLCDKRSYLPDKRSRRQFEL